MNAWVESMAYWLADFYLAATVLFAAALVAMRACRQPAKRLAVAKAAIVAAALLAALCALPGWSVVSLSGVDAREAPAVAPIAALPAVIPANELPRFEEAAPIAPAAAPLQRPAGAEFAWNWNVPWLTLLVAGFFVGCAAVALWLLAGVMAATRLVRRAEQFPEALRDALRDAAGAGELLVSKEVDVPVALGVFRPRVILPQEWVETRTSAELSTVLAHEAAHIRNGDLKWLAASRLLLVALWAQPLYWWLRRQIRLDQETLADAAATEVAGRQAYAEQLLAWAHDVVPRPRPLLPASVGLWEGASQLRRRVEVLVDDRFTVLLQCSREWMCGALTAAFVLVALLSTLTIAPTASVAIAAPEGQKASEEAETQHQSIGGGAVTRFVAGNPATPWDYEPNAVRLEIEDAEGKPVAGVEATLFRVAQATGEREQVRQTQGDAKGVVEFRDVVAADVASQFQQKLAAGGFPGSMRDVFYVVLKQPRLGTVILPASDFTIATRGVKRRIRMRPAADLSGRVTDKDGMPVTGATVAAGAMAGSFMFEGANAVTSDSDGRYQFTNLVAFDRAAGNARLQEQMKWATSANPTKSKLYPPIYDPAEDSTVTDLVVTHRDFAVTTTRGGDVPGETNVVMQTMTAIEGRVVEFGSGKPAAGVVVKAVGQISAQNSDVVYQAADSSAPLFEVGMHTATTRTDGEGRYRLHSLPAGTYDVWVESQLDDLSTTELVSRGVTGIRAKAGETSTRAPELTVGPGATIRGRLIDATTGQPPALGEDGAVLQAGFILAGPQSQQNLPMQRVALSPDGEFRLRVVPGKLRIMLIVDKPGDGPGAPGDYRSDDDVWQTGQLFNLQHGESAEASFRVWPWSKVESLRSGVVRGFELLNEGKLEEALVAFGEVIAQDGRNTAALQGRGQVLERQGRFREATADYDAVLKITPDDIGMMWQLADIFSTAPDDNAHNGKRAVELATAAMAAMRRQNARPDAVAWGLRGLAAAQAEAGDFNAAVATQREAMAKAPEGMRAEMRKRLELYEAGKAWRREAGTK